MGEYNVKENEITKGEKAPGILSEYVYYLEWYVECEIDYLLLEAT